MHTRRGAAQYTFTGSFISPAVASTTNPPVRSPPTHSSSRQPAIRPSAPAQLSSRTNERTDGRTDGRTGGRTNERKDERTDGQTGRTDGREVKWTNVVTNRRTDNPIDSDGRIELTDGRTGGRMYERMHRRTGGRKARRTNGQTGGRSKGRADGPTNERKCCANRINSVRRDSVRPGVDEEHRSTTVCWPRHVES